MSFKHHTLNRIKGLVPFSINLIFIITLSISSTSIVFAQIETTPTVIDTPFMTETATPEATQTEEWAITATDEPAIESTITPTPELTDVVTDVSKEDLPNLIPVTPESWEAPVVLSVQTGTHISDTLSIGEEVYLDLAIFNSGVSIDQAFTVCIFIDNNQINCWDVDSLAADTFFLIEDWIFPTEFDAGIHNIEVKADNDDDIIESDETDNSWSYDFTWNSADIENLSERSPLIDDARVWTDHPGIESLSASESNAPGYYDTSAYMIGSVAVGIILPDSTGSGTTENWTSTEISNIRTKIAEGLNRWVEWSNNTSGNIVKNKDRVAANVTFDIKDPVLATVNYEPIKLSTSYTDENRLIHQTMDYLGFSNEDGATYQIYDYLEDLRTTNNTNWAVAIYVVDSSYDADGTFSDGYFAHAYINGPMIMMTYDNGGWGIGDMDLVVQHEMGHIFGAGDNYFQEGYGGCNSTTKLYGYLGIANSNCAYKNPAADINVLMNNNTYDRNHWTAQYQVGWKDSDGDTIADVVDTKPVFSLNNLDDYLNVTGVVYDEPVPHASSYNGTVGVDVTINTIVAAQYRIDSNDWTIISADDGTFDTDYEEVAFTLPEDIEDGTHTLEVESTNSRGNSEITSLNFTIPLAAHANDRMSKAKSISLNTTYTDYTKWATITSDEPSHIVNSDDTTSVWYKYTVPSAGIYTVNVFGSAYSPDITIVKGSPTSYTNVVFGDTNMNDEETSQLSFYAKASTTYFIGLSGGEDSSTLKMRLTKLTCGSNRLCGAVIGGDGGVVHYPSIKIISGTSQVGSGYGDYSGIVHGYTYNGKSGSYKIVTSGNGSFIVNSSVTIPGIYSPTAVGLPKTSITVLDTNGIEIDTDSIAVVSTSNNAIGEYLDGTATGSPLILYAAAGTYNISAANDTIGLIVYQPGITINSSTNPGTVTLNASSLSQDTFSFDLDGISSSYVWINRPDYYAHYLTINGNRTVTYAAPLNTRIPYIFYEFYETDVNDLSWNYDMYLKQSGEYSTTIQGNFDHSVQVGGSFNLTPDIENDPIRLDETYAYIYSGAVDTYNNDLYEVYTYDNSDSNSNLFMQSSNETLFSLENREIVEFGEGNLLYLDLNNNGITTLGSSYIEVVPNYSVLDSNNISVETATVSYLYEPSYFFLSSTDSTGTWEVNESLDVGPFGGEITGSSDFEVYSLSEYPLTNDDFANAISILGLLSESFKTDPAINTMGATTARDDPNLPKLLSKGYASVWYKYIAEHDGVLSIDTSGSDYDTVLSVWTGSRGSLVNKGYNDDYDDGSDTHHTYSSLDIEVTSGKTYYIEVTQYASSSDENIYVQSTEDNPKITSDLESQQIGGSLTLNASLLPCYSLSAKPNVSTYGKVKISPAANCLSTKYTSGTDITLTATPTSKYGFLNWSDTTTDSPYVFSITQNTVLKANFVYLPAPKLIYPGNALRTNDQTPTFTWNAVTNGSTYEIQIDNASTFTTPIEMTEIIPDLTFTPSTDLSEKTHYWRVRTITARGEIGAWSGVRSFTVDVTPPKSPGLKTPSNGVTVRGTPKYTWSVPTSAKAYIFEYDDDENFESPVFTSPELKTYTYRPPLQDPGTYYWHVKVRDVAGNWSAWSTSRSITILPVIPVAPALSSPASGGWVNSSQPTFTWKSVPYGDTYQIQISKVYTFKTTEVDVNGISELSFTCLSDLADGTYYWRVRAINITPENGKWSAYRIVKIDTVAQAVPVLKSPTDASTVLTNRPTLSVNALVSGAKYIQFQVSASDDFTIPLVDTKVTASTFKVPALPYGTYYWHARSVDAAGNESEWTGTRSYHTTILKTPADLSSTTDTTPKFTWAAASGAKRYRIQVSTTPDFSTYDQYEVSYSVLSYSPSKVLSIGTDYYWRMQVKTSSGWASYWTPYYEFTITE